MSKAQERNKTKDPSHTTIDKKGMDKAQEMNQIRRRPPAARTGRRGDKLCNQQECKDAHPKSVGITRWDQSKDYKSYL
jgi:hypothetical protein